MLCLVQVHTVQYCNKCRKCMQSFCYILYNKTRQYRSSNLMSNITLYYNLTPVPIHLSFYITWSPYALFSNSSFLLFLILRLKHVRFAARLLTVSCTQSSFTSYQPTHSNLYSLASAAPKIENSECNLKIPIQLFSGRGLGCSSYLHRFHKNKKSDNLYFIILLPILNYLSFLSLSLALTHFSC